MRRRYWPLFLFLVSLHAFAEQGCAPGFYPGGMQPNGAVCVPIPGYGMGGATSPSVGARWVNRFGAIAMDPAMAEGGTGISVGQASERRARKEAISRCRESGGISCEVKVTFRNGCGVIVLGTDLYFSTVGPSIEQAAMLGMSDCNEKTENCRVFLADCSLAELRH